MILYSFSFKIFKEAELFLRFGRSFLNRGTEFSEKESFFDNDGNVVISFIGSFDTSYEPWNWRVGYKKKKVSFMLGAYTSSNTEYFVDVSTFIIPYLQFKYNFGKL